MFDDLYDAVSMFWSWRWPVADGEITAVDIERNRDSDGGETVRLAVAYKFSLGDDGPYTGESFWTPTYAQKTRVARARRRFRLRQKVRVRYRPDDPSVNRLSGGVKGQLGKGRGSPGSRGP
jgi:hypothetical protein